MTLNVSASGNNCGIVVAGNHDTGVTLWVYAARPVGASIHLTKIGGDYNITLSGACTTDGVITITASAYCAMFAIYCGAIS